MCSNCLEFIGHRVASFDTKQKGRPPGTLVFSLMVLIGDPVYEHLSKGFRGQPRQRANIFCCGDGSGVDGETPRS